MTRQNDAGIVRLGGKNYHTVAKRIGDFRAAHPIDAGWAVVTDPVTVTDEIVMFRAAIVDPEGRTVAVGFAEERRTKGRGVNATSALENCESSAIGRCLAAAGYVGSGSYASADEVIAARARRAVLEAAPSSTAPTAPAEPPPVVVGPDSPGGVPVPEEYSEEHDPSWAGERVGFCTAIQRDTGTGYDALTAWLEGHGFPRPSHAPRAWRADLYKWLKYGGGAAVVAEQAAT